MNRRKLLSFFGVGFAFLQGFKAFGGFDRRKKVKVIKFAGANWISNVNELFENVEGKSVSIADKNKGIAIGMSMAAKAVASYVQYETIVWLPEENAIFTRLDLNDPGGDDIRTRHRCWSRWDWPCGDDRDKLVYGLVKIIKRVYPDFHYVFLQITEKTFHKSFREDFCYVHSACVITSGEDLTRRVYYVNKNRT